MTVNDRFRLNSLKIGQFGLFGLSKKFGYPKMSKWIPNMNIYFFRDLTVVKKWSIKVVNCFRFKSHYLNENIKFLRSEFLKNACNSLANMA